VQPWFDCDLFSLIKICGPFLQLNYIWWSVYILWSSRSKLHTYDDVVMKVAQHLGLSDSSKIRLTSHNCYSQQPKSQPIKYQGVENLSDMLIHLNQVVLQVQFFLDKNILKSLQFARLPNGCLFYLCSCYNELFSFVFLFVDFWYTILWNIGYPSARIAKPKNS